MDFRKVFDNKVTPEDFDKWRNRYCDELFADVTGYSKLDITKTALEIGPGTGQATEPILKTGCSYMAIELGENFTEDMKNKYGSYNNFQIVNADFETYDFGKDKFDLVYSAATIQWIPEEIAFPKVYNILKCNGTLAMFMTHTDYKSSNEAGVEKIWGHLVSLLMRIKNKEAIKQKQQELLVKGTGSSSVHTLNNTIPPKSFSIDLVYFLKKLFRKLYNYISSLLKDNLDLSYNIAK